MAIITKYGPTTEQPNWLGSEIGLTPKTHTIPKSMGTAEGGRTVVKSGTVYPANDNTAIGIVYQTYDVTDGDEIGSVVEAGRVYGNRLPVEPDSAAITALAAKGLYVVDCPETSRPADTLVED